MHFYADGVELLDRYINYRSYMFVSLNYILSYVFKSSAILSATNDSITALMQAHISTFLCHCLM